MFILEFIGIFALVDSAKLSSSGMELMLDEIVGYPASGYGLSIATLFPEGKNARWIGLATSIF